MEGIHYSIKDLENFTKIKAHTIRIWEQRYGLLNPKRTGSNIRYYSESDVKKILNVNLLYKRGLKISKIALLSEDEIIDKAKSIVFEYEDDEQKHINDFTLLILNYDKLGLESYLKEEISKSDFLTVYRSIVLPLLAKLGELWQVNSIEIIHEHFFSNVFREFVITQISQLKNPEKDADKVILFLHDNEEHEFSILVYYFLLKSVGYNCIYLGQKAPVKEVYESFKMIKPTLVITSFTSKIKVKTFDRIMLTLNEMTKKSKVVVSGIQLDTPEFILPKSVKRVNTIADFQKLMELN